MGVVYEATDCRLGRKVAIKLLHERSLNDPERLARFEREAKLLAALNHPNIAAIHAIERAEGRIFLVLEYVPGDTLADKIAKGPLVVRECLHIARQVAHALEAAHEAGIIHRDLKPAKHQNHARRHGESARFRPCKTASSSCSFGRRGNRDSPLMGNGSRIGPAKRPFSVRGGVFIVAAAAVPPDRSQVISGTRRLRSGHLTQSSCCSQARPPALISDWIGGLRRSDPVIL